MLYAKTSEIVDAIADARDEIGCEEMESGLDDQVVCLDQLNSDEYEFYSFDIDEAQRKDYNEV